MKKQRGSAEHDSEKKKKAGAEAENDNVTGDVTDAANETGEVKEEAADGTEKTGETQNAAGDDGEKQPSESDVLKVYLKQALEELKKTKSENEELKKNTAQLNTKIAECGESFERMSSEYENYRRRTTQEKEKLAADAISKAVLALLPSLDNLERAVPFADSNPESFKKGVEMTLKQFEEAIKSLGVEEIEAQGAVFDPELHDAVMHIDDDTVGESVVTEVFQKGYRMGDKVVRHSVVKVAN